MGKEFELRPEKKSDTVDEVVANRDTDGSVNIIFNFGRSGSPGSANFVSDRACL